MRQGGGGRPDFSLVITKKVGRGEREAKSRWIEVGAAWHTKTGAGINLKFNPGVVLDWKLAEEYQIFLFPYGEGRTGRQSSNHGDNNYSDNPGMDPTDFDDDPIPF